MALDSSVGGNLGVGQGELPSLVAVASSAAADDDGDASTVCGNVDIVLRLINFVI